MFVQTQRVRTDKQPITKLILLKFFLIQSSPPRISPLESGEQRGPLNMYKIVLIVALFTLAVQNARGSPVTAEVSRAYRAHP